MHILLFNWKRPDIKCRKDRHRGVIAIWSTLIRDGDLSGDLSAGAQPNFLILAVTSTNWFEFLARRKRPFRWLKVAVGQCTSWIRSPQFGQSMK